MTLITRRDSFGLETDIDTTHITRASRLVQTITGQSVQLNKAIVGANAFAHESGIHQHGVLENPLTYEIMTPESVGLKRSSLVLGKHSGRHAFNNKIRELGFNLGDNALEDAFVRFKALADKKKEVYEEDIIALIDANAISSSDAIQFKSLRISCGSEGEQTAELTLVIDGEEKTTKTSGVGSVDATFKAIRALVPHSARLKLYQVHAVTQGTDAQAEVTVRLVDEGGVIANGHGANMDTMTASAMAYINALSRLQKEEQEQKIPYASDATGITGT